jgi:hypothetical protein
MDLITAHNLMKADNAKWFKCTYENAEKKDDSCLIEYIEEVCADTAWVRSLPTNIKARSTLTKPKTALMSHSSRDPLEEQLKSDLKMNLERTQEQGVHRCNSEERAPNDSDDSRSEYRRRRFHKINVFAGKSTF